jgi:hypothetical protein
MTRIPTFGVMVAISPATILINAQVGEDSISLGSLKLTLGTSEQAIRAKLPKNYTLELNDPDRLGRLCLLPRIGTPACKPWLLSRCGNQASERAF